MARLYTAEELIASVRQRGGFPPSGVASADDASILRFLNEEMFTRFVPGLMKINEEYFVATQRIEITSATHYRIPTRAIGQKILDMALVDSNGDEADDASGSYYIEGNHIVVVDDDLIGNYIEVSYYMRPGEILLSTACRIVVGVDTSTGTITLDSNVPTTWIAGTEFDVHSPHSGSEIKLWDLFSTIVSSNTVTTTTAIDGSVFGTKAAEVGDYLVPAGSAALPGIPRELHPTLAQAAVVRVHESLGNMEAAAAAKSTLNELMSAAAFMVDNRVEAQPKRIINHDSPFFGGASSAFGSW